MSKKYKVLILGANGGIGKYLVDYFNELDRDDLEIIGTGRHPYNFGNIKNFSYIQMDMFNKEDFDKLPKDVYAVIALAGAMPARMKGYHPEQYINTNIVGMFNVLEYCRKNNVDRIIYTQSFGDIKDKAEKDILLKPDMKADYNYGTDHSVYVVSKNTAVELIKCYHALHGLKYFIFRLPTVYSWSHNDSYYVDGVLKKRAWRILIDKAIKGEEIEVWGDPTRQKDMVYVKDFCQMLYLSCIVDRDFGYYNVGSGVGTSLQEQIEGMVKVFGDNKKSNIVFRPDKPNAPQYIMDISNAKDELGYEPKYSYLDMLYDMKKEKELGRF